MSDLQRILNRMTVLREEIASRQREMEELETAARVIRRLPPAEGDSPPASNGAPARPTILSMAREILSGGREMYYGDVADQAIARGYKGKRGSKADRIRQSFWAIMNRNKEVFEAIGGGNFKLKDETA